MWISSALFNEAELDNARQEIWKLKKFFSAVGDLTLHHDVAYNTQGEEIASVSPRKLGELLETIDPNWYRNNDTAT